MSVAEELGFDFASEPCEQFPISRYPCRKCLPCLHRRQQEWVARLIEELRQHEYNYFVTLTYDEPSVPADEYGQMCFDSARIIKLHRDLRKRYQDGRFRPPLTDIIDAPKYISLPLDQEIKYYVTSEYCPTSTERPHYHAIYYNLGVDLYTAELLFKSLWPEGYVTVYEAKEGAAGYISKYLIKDNTTTDSYQDDTRMSPISIMSKGLGKSYVKRMMQFHQDDPRNRQYYQSHGEKKVLARYYKEKLFTKEFRQENMFRYQELRGRIKDKYRQLQYDDPELYVRVLYERRKYFEDLKENERWNYLKKHSM